VEDDQGEDCVTDTEENTRQLQIKEMGIAAQADTSDGFEFAHVHVLSRGSKTRQSGGYIHDDKTSAIETEARKHEDDDPRIFQVIKKS
jgi:hypothetical protein